MSHQDNELRPTIYENNITKTSSDSKDNCYSAYANALHQLSINSNKIETKTCSIINANSESEHNNILLKVYNNTKIEPYIGSNRILNNTIYASPYLSSNKYDLPEKQQSCIVDNNLNANISFTSSSPKKLQYSFDGENDYDSSNSDLGIDTFGPSSSTSDYSDDVCMTKNYLYNGYTFPGDFKNQTNIKRTHRKYWSQKKFKACNLRREVKLYKTKNKNWKTLNKKNYAHNVDIEKLYNILVSEHDEKLRRTQEEIIVLTKRNNVLEESIFINNDNLHIINEKVNNIIGKLNVKRYDTKPKKDKVESKFLKHLIEKLEFIYSNVEKEFASPIPQNETPASLKMYNVMSSRKSIPIKNSSEVLEAHNEKLRIIELVMQLENDEKIRRQDIAISTLLKKVAEILREKKAVDKKLLIIEEDLVISKKSETFLKQQMQELNLYKSDSCQKCTDLKKKMKEHDTYYKEKVILLEKLCKSNENENLMLKTKIRKQCNENDVLQMQLGKFKSTIKQQVKHTAEDSELNLTKNKPFSQFILDAAISKLPWRSMEERVLASQSDVTRKSSQILNLNKKLTRLVEQLSKSEQSWKNVNENLRLELHGVQEENQFKSKTIHDQNIFIEELKILLRINSEQYQLLKQQLQQSKHISVPFKLNGGKYDEKKIDELIKRSAANLKDDCIKPVKNSLTSLKTDMTTLLDHIYKNNIVNKQKQMGLSLFQELNSATVEI